jgi:hypothetical protein
VTDARLRRRKVIFKTRDVRRKTRKEEVEAYRKLMHEYLEEKKRSRRKSSDAQEPKDKKPQVKKFLTQYLLGGKHHHCLQGHERKTIGS